MLFNPPYQFHWRAAADGCGDWPSLSSPFGPDIRLGQYMYRMTVGFGGPGTCSRLTGFGMDLGVPHREDGTPISGSSAFLIVSTNILQDLFFSVDATLAGASNRGWMKIYLEEFNSSGVFMGSQAGTPRDLFNESAFYLDAHIRRTITTPFVLSSIFRVIPGRSYRLWIDLEGRVQAMGMSTIAFLTIGSRANAIVAPTVQSVSATFVA